MASPRVIGIGARIACVVSALATLIVASVYLHDPLIGLLLGVVAFFAVRWVMFLFV